MRFMRGELALAERREIVRHLLTGCVRCAALTRTAWSLGEGPDRAAGAPRPLPLSSGDARPSRRQEGRLAAIRLVELYELPPSERLSAVEEDPCFHLAGLCRLLLKDVGRWSTEGDRLAAAELAVALAVRLDPAQSSSGTVAALGLRAWTVVGLARRSAGDREGALRAALEARAPLAAGLQSLQGEAHLLELEALLYLDDQRPAEAEQALAAAVSLYRRDGGGRRLGRALVRQGVVRSRLGDARASFAAIRLLREGLDALGAESDPRASACALHWLGILRGEKGEAREALTHFEEARDLYSSAGDLENRARVWFAEGMLWTEAGRVAEADRSFLAAEAEFLAIGSGRSAGQTLVQRTLLRLQLPGVLPLHGLGAEVLPILRCHDLTRGDAAALVLFRRLVESERPAAGLLTEVFHFLAAGQAVLRPRAECAPL